MWWWKMNQPCLWRDSLPAPNLTPLACPVGRDDFQKISKKYFGVLVFECRLPKENSLSACGTFTRTPIPPSNTTILTEFLDKGQNKTFPRFSCFFGTVVSVPDQTFISYQEKHYGCVGKWPGYVLYPPPVLV